MPKVASPTSRAAAWPSSWGIPTRAACAASDPRAASDAEVRAALDSYLAYFGSYTIRADHGIVVHHPEMASIPNWTGSDQVRYFDLQGGRFTLRTPPILMGGVEQVASLVWERLP